MASEMTDEEIRDRLLNIDCEDDLYVTTWEADFLESVLYGSESAPKPLSKRQRAIAMEMIEKHQP